MKSESRQTAREQAMELVLAVWRAIDHENMSPDRRRGIYDELGSKIADAAYTSDLQRFAANLCRSFDVRCPSGDRVLDISRHGDHEMILDVLRSEAVIVVLMLREHQEGVRERAKEKLEREDQLAASANIELAQVFCTEEIG